MRIFENLRKTKTRENKKRKQFFKNVLLSVLFSYCNRNPHKNLLQIYHTADNNLKGDK